MSKRWEALAVGGFIGWAIVLHRLYTSARGYVKTLGVVLCCDIAGGLCSSRHAMVSGNCWVLATPFSVWPLIPGRSYRFHAFRQERCVIQCVSANRRYRFHAVTAERSNNRASRHCQPTVTLRKKQTGPTFIHHRHLPSSSSFNNDNFSGGGGSIRRWRRVRKMVN